MIVGSLLLILVAVTMLILGLAAGSSALLIGSIAASLLAAVALVVGARQAAAARAEAGPTDAGRTSRSPLAVDLDDDPGPATAVFDADTTMHGDGAVGDGPVHRRSGENAHSGERFGDDHHGDGWSSVAVADRDTIDRDTTHRGTGDADSSDPTDPGVSGPDTGTRTASAAGAADTEILHADRSGTFDRQVPFADVPPYRSEADPAYQRQADDFSAWSGSGRDDAGNVPDDDLRAYDLPDPAQAGRDDVLAEMTAHPMAPADPLHADPLHADPRFAQVPPGDSPPDDASPAGATPAGAVAADAVVVDDIDEDPADEPLPQRVQPADAVRVSRMTADVLVVDGRPRFHLADCRHLVDKESEPIPVGEAVDLGFTACGLCRPVDVLVGETSRR
jgi:clumping factor A